jgi:hypothetical protein
MWSNRTNPENKSFEELKKTIQKKLQVNHSMLRQSGIPAQPGKIITPKDR